MSLAYYQGALRTEGRAGLIVAVWRDGTIVRTVHQEKPWEKHIIGSLGAKDLKALAAPLARGDIWSVVHGDVAADVPQVWLVLQQGEQRWAWWESPGFTRTRELQETVAMLLHFHVQSSADLEGSFERSWPCTSGRLEH
jgi:hypothetical protein